MEHKLPPMGGSKSAASPRSRLGSRRGVHARACSAIKLESLVASVHGDDVLMAGAKPDLDWFDDKEGRVLNIIIRWTQDGLEYEADPRQIERLIEASG